MTDITTATEQNMNIDTLSGFNPFDTDQTSVQPTTVPAAQAQPPVTTPAAAATPPAAATIEEEVVDENSFLKNHFGWDSIETAKADIQRWKDLEANPKTIEKPVEFANDDSRRVFEYVKGGKLKELREFLDTQDSLSAVETMESQRAIELQLKLANKHYTADDVRDIWDERYAKPDKPVQQEEELDSDYNARVAKWQEQISKIDRRINRDGVAAKEQLAKMKTELVFPDITGTPDPKVVAAQQELEARQQKERADFVKLLSAEGPKFNGFKVAYDGKDAKYDVAFSTTEDQRTALVKQLSEFNVPEFFGQRWFDENGAAKIDLMMSDLFLLQNKEQVLKKLVNDSADQRLELHIKERKNVQIQPSQSPTTVITQAAPQDQAMEEVANWLFAR